MYCNLFELKIIGTLQEIAMPQNGIQHEGIGALAESFKENQNLKVQLQVPSHIESKKSFEDNL